MLNMKIGKRPCYKNQLEVYKDQIEEQMQNFRKFENSMKTKTYSSKNLEKENKEDELTVLKKMVSKVTARLKEVFEMAETQENDKRRKKRKSRKDDWYPSTDGLKFHLEKIDGVNRVLNDNNLSMIDHLLKSDLLEKLQNLQEHLEKLNKKEDYWEMDFEWDDFYAAYQIEFDHSTNVQEAKVLKQEIIQLKEEKKEDEELEGFRPKCAETVQLDHTSTQQPTTSNVPFLNPNQPTSVLADQPLSSTPMKYEKSLNTSTAHSSQFKRFEEGMRSPFPQQLENVIARKPQNSFLRIPTQPNKERQDLPDSLNKNVCNRVKNIPPRMMAHNRNDGMPHLSQQKVIKQRSNALQIPHIPLPSTPKSFLTTLQDFPPFRNDLSIKNTLSLNNSASMFQHTHQYSAISNYIQTNLNTNLNQQSFQLNKSTFCLQSTNKQNSSYFLQNASLRNLQSSNSSFSKVPPRHFNNFVQHSTPQPTRPPQVNSLLGPFTHPTSPFLQQQLDFVAQNGRVIPNLSKQTNSQRQMYKIIEEKKFWHCEEKPTVTLAGSSYDTARIFTYNANIQTSHIGDQQSLHHRQNVDFNSHGSSTDGYGHTFQIGTQQHFCLPRPKNFIKEIINAKYDPRYQTAPTCKKTSAHECSNVLNTQELPRVSLKARNVIGADKEPNDEILQNRYLDQTETSVKKEPGEDDEANVSGITSEDSESSFEAELLLSGEDHFEPDEIEAEDSNAYLTQDNFSENEAEDSNAYLTQDNSSDNGEDEDESSINIPWDQKYSSGDEHSF